MLKAAPVSEVAFGLISVMVSVLLAPAAMLVGLNTCVTLGGASVLSSLVLLYQAITAEGVPVNVMLLKALIVSLAGAGLMAVA